MKPNWTSTQATIFSAEYVEPESRGVPFWRCVYSYKVDGEFYSGQFVDVVTSDVVTYKRDDTISIQYDPSKPSRSQVPDISTSDALGKTPYVVGAVLGMIALIVLILAKLSKP